MTMTRTLHLFGLFLAAFAAVGSALATGAFQYQSSVMPGFTLQNTPMAGPDGTIYLSRTQNNVITDFFYAFTDTGTALVEKWNVAADWGTASEFTIGKSGWKTLPISPGVSPLALSIICKAPNAVMISRFVFRLDAPSAAPVCT